MRALRAMILIACSIIVTGCWTLSLQPLYTTDDITFKPELVGVWGDPQGKADGTWSFSTADSNSYRLVIDDQNKPKANFEVHLVELNGQLFMDIFPQEPKELNESVVSHLVPAHSLWKVTLGNSKLVLAMIDAEWLGEGLDAKTLNIEHIVYQDVAILTAPTADLQKFITTHVDVAFTDDPFILHRRN